MHHREAGVIGEAGELRAVIDDVRQVLIACYANPRVGALHSVVPIPDRLLPAANDLFFNGNIDQ